VKRRVATSHYPKAGDGEQKSPQPPIPVSCYLAEMPSPYRPKEDGKPHRYQNHANPKGWESKEVEKAKQPP
jgi:hypothetical protein